MSDLILPGPRRVDRLDDYATKREVINATVNTGQQLYEKISEEHVRTLDMLETVCKDWVLEQLERRTIVGRVKRLIAWSRTKYWTMRESLEILSYELGIRQYPTPDAPYVAQRDDSEYAPCAVKLRHLKGELCADCQSEVPSVYMPGLAGTSPQ